jgi:uncharacterized protein
VEYHRVLAGEKRRIGRGVLAVVLLLAGMVVFPTVIGRAAALIDVQWGNNPPSLTGGTDHTPLHNAATMFSLALLIPWSMGIQRWLYGVRGASLHSVVSRFRFDMFGRALLFLGPVLVIVLMLGVLLIPGEETYWSHADLIGVVLGVLLLTPLQTAGEEYGVRGLLFRVAGSWARGPRAGLVVGVLVTSMPDCSVATAEGSTRGAGAVHRHLNTRVRGVTRPSRAVTGMRCRRNSRWSSRLGSMVSLPS